MNNSLFQNLDFLHVLLDAVPSMLLVVDSDVKVFHVNSAASRLIGNNPKTVIMRRGGEALHCIHAAETPGGCGHAASCRDCIIRNSVGEAANGNSVCRKDAKMRLGSANSFVDVHMQITASPLAYGDSNYVLLAIEDISDLKRTEEALLASEATLRNITSMIGEGIYVLDLQGRLTFMNPEAERLLGWTEEELLGRKVHEVIHFQKADGRPLPADECPVLRTISNGGMFRAEDDVFTRKDGTLFPVAIVATPLQEAGQITGSVAAFQDITERKRAAGELKLLNEILARQATTDPLTGISNRLKFNDLLNAEIRRASRFGTPLSLIMFDIDHFKQINDSFGHYTGDTVLRELTGLVAQSVRVHDLFARWGGEEFMIMVTNTPADNARQFAEKLRLRIESREFTGNRRVTCSFGVVQLCVGDTDDSFTRRADDALYRAKTLGRNRVETA
jgi:diguanylate cyclase (GGDEF)-like protein/PAS domain S-box-containing protein